MRNARGRPVCNDLSCDVEIAELTKYCQAHKWIIDQWLKRSRGVLDRLIANQKEAA